MSPFLVFPPQLSKQPRRCTFFFVLLFVFSPSYVMSQNSTNAEQLKIPLQFCREPGAASKDSLCPALGNARVRQMCCAVFVLRQSRAGRRDDETPASPGGRRAAHHLSTSDE